MERPNHVWDHQDSTSPQWDEEVPPGHPAKATQVAFAQLCPIWRSNIYSLQTKMLLYNSNVKSVLLYGSESWRVFKTDIKRMEVFHNGCLRRICQIFWSNKISNNELYMKTGSWSITKEMTHRRLRWLGHVLRTEQDRITKVALRWTPPGKRKPGGQNHLAQNCDTRAETDEPVVGRGPTCSQGPYAMEGAHWSFMSHKGRRVTG